MYIYCGIEVQNQHPKSRVYLYIINKLTAKEMWELIPFTLATRGKCLGIKLSRETKGLYNEVVKTLKTEIAEDIRI